MSDEEKRLSACARSKAWRLANPDRYRATKKKYAEANKAQTASRGAKWAKENKGRVKSNFAAWYAANCDTVRARSLEWAEKNKARVEKNQAAYRRKKSAKRCLDAATRRAIKSGSQPKWANSFFISEAYDLARRRNKCLAGGVRWQVDHVVPLKSKLVCGLHVEHNLAVIPAAQNSAKGNRYWPDMP